MLLDRLSVFVGRLRSDGGRGGVRRGAAACPRTSSTSGDLARRQVAGHGRARRAAASRYGLLETIREFAREHLSKRYDMLGNESANSHSERLVDRDDVAATAARHCELLPRHSPRLRAAVARTRAGGMDAAPGGRTRQLARRDRVGAGGRSRSGDRGQVRSRA